MGNIFSGDDDKLYKVIKQKDNKIKSFQDQIVIKNKEIENTKRYNSEILIELENLRVKLGETNEELQTSKEKLNKLLVAFEKVDETIEDF